MGLRRMALRTVVILCLVLLSITLTFSNKQKNSKVRRHHGRPHLLGNDNEIESTEGESKHGVGKETHDKDEGNDYNRDLFPSMEANDYEDRDLFPSMEANDYNDDRWFPSMEAK